MTLVWIRQSVSEFTKQKGLETIIRGKKLVKSSCRKQVVLIRYNWHPHQKIIQVNNFKNIYFFTILLNNLNGNSTLQWKQVVQILYNWHPRQKIIQVDNFQKIPYCLLFYKMIWTVVAVLSYKISVQIIWYNGKDLGLKNHVLVLLWFMKLEP